MTYLTSWDINCILCLVTLGIPEDVVKGMMKVVKKTHEAYSLKEATDYWISNSPRFLSRHQAGWCRFQINETLSFQQTRINVFNRRKTITKEFKKEWRLRSIEERQRKVIEWCKFGDDFEKQRHHERLSKASPYILPIILKQRQKGEVGPDLKKYTPIILKQRQKGEIEQGLKKYTKNLWSSWEAWGYTVNTPEYMNDATYAGRYSWDRRECVSQWYEGIHPGRFFLFYKENMIIEQRKRGLSNGPCEDGNQYSKIPIFDRGPYEQLIEDLRCIDGPGLGELGTKVEHIDDLFLH